MSRQVGELNTLAEDMRRQLRLPQTPEERAAARIEADLRAADRQRQLDEDEVVTNSNFDHSDFTLMSRDS